MSTSNPGFPGASTQLVALIGDLTLDNGHYVAGEPDVIAVLRTLLPMGWDALLLAKDGNVITDVAEQLRNLPQFATRIVLSVGGNDALRLAGIFSQRVNSVGEALAMLADERDTLAASYRAMLDAVLAHGLPTAICTIYEPAFPDARFRRLASIALAILNDCILREAFVRRLPAIDLRLVSSSDDDFVSVIEPSATGGAKIARAIARLLAEARFTGNCSEVFG